MAAVTAGGSSAQSLHNGAQPRVEKAERSQLFSRCFARWLGSALQWAAVDTAGRKGGASGGDLLPLHPLIATVVPGELPEELLGGEGKALV